MQQQTHTATQQQTLTAAGEAMEEKLTAPTDPVHTHSVPSSKQSAYNETSWPSGFNDDFDYFSDDGWLCSSDEEEEIEERPIKMMASATMQWA